MRVSLHPTTTDDEARRLVAAIADLAAHHRAWAADYTYQPATNEFTHRQDTGALGARVEKWFGGFPSKP